LGIIYLPPKPPFSSSKYKYFKNLLIYYKLFPLIYELFGPVKMASIGSN